MTVKKEINTENNEIRFALDYAKSILNSKRFIFYLLIFAFLLLVLFPFLRPEGFQTIFAEESLSNLRLGHQLSNKISSGDVLGNFFNFRDDASVVSEKTSLNIYSLFVAFLDSNVVLLRIINIVLSLFILYFFNIFLRFSKTSLFIANIASLIIVLSPAYIYFALAISPMPLIVLLFLSSALFFRKIKLRVFSYLISILMLMFGLKIAVAYLFFVLAMSIYFNKIRFFYYHIISMGIFYLLLKIFELKFALLPFTIYSGSTIIREIIVEFGGLHGISAMLVAVFIFEFIKKFFAKKMYFLELLLMIIFITVFLYEFRVFYILMFAVALLAASGIASLYDSKWYSTSLQGLSILIIFCGLLFSAISYTGQYASSPPSALEISGLEWLSSKESGTILTIPDSSELVRFYTGMPTVLSSSEFDPNMYDDIGIIFNSLDLETTQDLLLRHDIKYIVITPRMKEALWEKSDQGLQFLFRNKQTFSQIYLEPEVIEIWEVLDFSKV